MPGVCLSVSLSVSNSVNFLDSCIFLFWGDNRQVMILAENDMVSAAMIIVDHRSLVKHHSCKLERDIIWFGVFNGVVMTSITMLFCFVIALTL